jgi:hypothetical protein
MKNSVQSLLNQRARIAWQCVGLFVFLAGVAAAQEVPTQSSPVKPSDSLPRAATFSDPASAAEQVQFDVVMAVFPPDDLDEWAKTHEADIKRIEGKSGEPARTKPALQFEPEVRQALLTKLKGNPAAVLMHFPAVVTVWGREVTVDTGDVPEEEGGMSVKLTPTQIGRGDLRLKIASVFRLSDEMAKVVPPTNWNLDLRTRADNTFLLPLADVGKLQRIVLLIQPKIVASVRATIVGSPQTVSPRRVTGFGAPAKSVPADVSEANVPARPAIVGRQSPYPSTIPHAGYPALSDQQVHMEVLLAVVPDEVLMKWAIPHKAIIKRVASNESRPTPLKKATPAASRQFSLLFGSEAPVPLLFDAELRESLMTALKKDTRTTMLAAPSVTTAWGREASITTGGDKNGKSPLAVKMRPTQIGKGELGLEIDAEIFATPDVPGGETSHWNLRARAGHTLMLPLAQPDLEKQLVLFVVPKIIAQRPLNQYATPQVIGAIPPARFQPVSPKPVQHPVYSQPYQTVPPKVYPPVPTPGYQPVPQTSYQPLPRPTATQARREAVAISADFVVAAANLIPDRTVEFTAEQRKSWLKSLTDSRTSKRQQIRAATEWNKATRLTTPRVKGSEAPFDLQITPKRGDDGQIILEVGGGINTLWPDRKQHIGIDTTLKTKPNITVLLPLPIHHPDGRHVALLIQPTIISVSPAPVAPPRQAVASAPEKDVATFQMLVLAVDAKIAREVVAAARKKDERLDNVDVQLPPEKGSKKRNARKHKVETRSFSMNASLGKLLIADLKKQDDSFQVLSRPQVRTLVGVGAAMEIHGGKAPAKQVAGFGTLKIWVTPKEVDGELLVSSALTLLGPPDEWTQGLKVEAEATSKCVPGETAVMMIGGKESERAVILLTDLVHLEKGQPRHVPPAAQVPPVPARASADPWTPLPRRQNLIQQAGPPVSNSAPAKTTDMRLVTLQAITGSGVAKGDTVDVLLGYAEDGDIEKAKVEMLCESVKVYESTRASDDSTTSVTLLVRKDQVETLLLGQLKGTLRLSVHKSTVQQRNPSLPGSANLNYGTAAPLFGQPVSPFRGPNIYRENRTSGPPDTAIQASGVQALPRPTPVTRKPKSEVQQVLEEVREMRKMIQGLREDMNQLRNSVRENQPATTEQTDLLLPKGTSRTLTREKRIMRVDGFDADIVGVHAKSANSVVVFGKRPGRSAVELYFEGEDKSAEKIVVAVMTERPDGNLTPLTPRPKAAGHLPPIPGTRPSPPMPVAGPQGPRTDLRLLVGHVRVMKRDRKVERIAVGSPSIAEVTQYSPQEYGITGLKPGRTNIVVWYEGEAALPITVAVEVLPTQASANVDPFSSTGSPESDTARRQIEQTLTKPVSIEMADGTLQQAIVQLRKTTGINIVIDATALEDEGVTTDAKVSLHLSGVSLRSALTILLSPFHLTTLVEDEVLKVTSQVRAKGAMVAMVYHVKDLVLTDKDGELDFDSLVELITSVVEPDSWQEVGGMGVVAPNAHAMSLVVRQTQDAHEEIQQLFSALRKWNLGDGPATSDREMKLGPQNPDLSPLREIDWSPKPKRNGVTPHPVKNPLERTISVDFEDGRLEEVLGHVAKSVDLKLAIDRKALEAEAVTSSRKISIHVDHVMAKSALNLILKPLKLRAVLEEENILKVTSLNERPTVRVYSVSHLILDPKVMDLKKLKVVIASSVEPTSWMVVGGEGTIASNEKTQSLVIRQNEAVHQEIAELLKQMADLQISPGDTIQAGPPPQTLNQSKPAEALPDKPPGDTGAPIPVPRRR